MTAPPETLLLRAAIAEGPAAQEAYEAWKLRQQVAELDWPAHRVLALLRDRLEDSEDPVARRIQRVVRMTWLKTQMLIVGAVPAVGALREAGIDVMLCKGLAVLHHTSWQIHQRPMDDIDILVRLPQAPAAAVILREHGYACPHLPADPSDTTIYSQLHALPFTNAAGAEIDLHWHFLHGSLHPDSDHEFWSAAVPADLRGVACVAPSREDALLAVLTHGQEATVDHALLWAADAVLLLRGARDELDWRALVRQATRQRVLAPLARALETLAELDAGLVPDEVRARLRRRPSVALMPAAARADAEARDDGPLPPARGRRAADVALEWVRRNIAPGVHPGARALASFAKEAWGLERGRDVPRHAAWVLGGRRRALAGRRVPARSDDAETYALPAEIGFMSGESGHALLRGGWWGYADVEGSWSRGVEAAVAIPLVPGSRARPLRLELEATPHLGETHPRLEVDLFCDGRRVARWGYSGSELSPQTRTATLPAGGDQLELRFVIRGRISRETARSGADARPLGLAIRTLRLGP